MILQNWWYTTLLGIKDPIQPPLEGNHKADIAIVGAGAAGLASAMQLMDRGLDVVVIERNICGGSSTGKSAGFLVPDSELELCQLVNRFGHDGASKLWEVALRGIEIMVDVLRKNNIPCDLVEQECLYVANNRTGWGYVQDEAETREEMGYPYTLYPPEDLPSVLGSTAFAGGVRYPGTYGINPLLYAQGIKRVLLEKGVRIHEASEVRAIDGHTIRTHMGSVTAEKIIFCIDKPDPTLTPYAWNTYHAQTFLAVSEPLSDRDAKDLFPERPFQCWDTDLVYSYYRLTGSNRILLGGGSMLTTFSKQDVTSPDVIMNVIRKFKKRFPCARDAEFIQYWPGRIDTTRDLLPTVLRDKTYPWIHHVMGCVGLPWATYCGDFVARHVAGDDDVHEEEFVRYFSIDRGFLIPLWMERFIGKQLVFSLNNAWAKYYQVDTDQQVPWNREHF